ncbi:thiol-disulfide oxidoreductase DCC family protein [Leptospira jelokensis]|uniref:Thiol-disulfide oxidoreductase DCC family protein n=1 Tax=Leptospira jelokensis TaxID=2484931 RepID=A0A4Z1A163_9LEPT|nr:thiol-disulfide oxidoreductase DCC family protein [Leptospira jelokensis]TGL69834.1 thiol-disulfide oxidoreductase DCC family protein [Leptospira jelokensis]TGM01198.1 thiol-disulfide oxidoreductase DCC family protein [Leptospira jelokensis]
MPLEKSKIVFFDGVCHLCMGSVQFLLKRNPSESLLFSSIGSKTYMEIVPKSSESTLPDSILYWKQGKLLVESDAILGITKELSFPWKLGIVFWIVPKWIRNAIYRFIAKHRYQWFGKAESCMVPTEGVKKRFLD